MIYPLFHQIIQKIDDILLIILFGCVFTYEMCDILKKHNFIVEYKKNVLDKNKAEIIIDLNPEITKLMLKRVSKPGQRIYLGKSKIKSVKNNYGIAIYSTSRGLMTNKEARKNNIGGELICEIY